MASVCACFLRLLLRVRVRARDSEGHHLALAMRGQNEALLFEQAQAGECSDPRS